MLVIYLLLVKLCLKVSNPRSYITALNEDNLIGLLTLA